MNAVHQGLQDKDQFFKEAKMLMYVTFYIHILQYHWFDLDYLIWNLPWIVSIFTFFWLKSGLRNSTHL